MKSPQQVGRALRDAREDDVDVRRAMTLVESAVAGAGAGAECLVTPVKHVCTHVRMDGQTHKANNYHIKKS